VTLAFVPVAADQVVRRSSVMEIVSIKYDTLGSNAVKPLRFAAIAF
jgi:hypothetical protein